MKHYFYIFLLCNFTNILSSQVITGTVYDGETGDSLPGVNVIIKNTIIGAATNQKGKFIITDLPADKYSLNVSMIGYIKRTFEINVNNDTTVLQIPLLTSNIAFDIKCDTIYDKNIDDVITLNCVNYWIEETDENNHILDNPQIVANVQILNNSNYPIYILNNNYDNWKTYCGDLYDSTYKIIASGGNGYIEYKGVPIFAESDIVKVNKHSKKIIQSVRIMNYFRDVDYNQTLYFKLKYNHGPRWWVIPRENETLFKKNIKKYLNTHCKLVRFDIESEFIKLNIKFEEKE